MTGDAALPPLSATERTRLRRMREKGRADRADLLAILREGLVCHLGVTVDGHPMVVPTAYGFDERHLYLHGSVASRSLRTAGTPACVTVTLVDGLVLARSVFEHAVNYRCAMIFGELRAVAEPEERLYGLRLLTEHMAPGQWGHARTPDRRELAATTLLALSLAEASVKVRSGPPDDGAGPDAALDVWAGELPVRTVFAEPVPDPALPEGRPVPPHVAARVGHRRSIRPDSRTWGIDPAIG